MQPPNKLLLQYCIYSKRWLDGWICFTRYRYYEGIHCKLCGLKQRVNIYFDIVRIDRIEFNNTKQIMYKLLQNNVSQ